MRTASTDRVLVNQTRVFIFRNRRARGQFRGWVHHPPQNPRLRDGSLVVHLGPGPRSRLEEDDEDVMMADGGPQDGLIQRRFNPYWRLNRRGEKRGGVAHGGGGGGRLVRTWFKITIPHARKYDRKWLLTALQNLCPVPFTPVHCSTEGNKVQFYIDDASTAAALSKVSRKITDSDGYKVVVFMNPCSSPPSFTLTDLKPEDLEHLKQCMSKRFDGSQQALDLSNIRTDPDLVSQHIEVILNRKSCMQAVIKIIEENIPELVSLNLSNNRLYRLDDLLTLVNKTQNLKILNLSHNELKSERELDKIRGLKLVELWLDRNPLCDHFKDQSTYVSTVRGRFPRLLRLDGHDLPAPIGFDVETPDLDSPLQGSYFGLEDIRCLIVRFVQQYYRIYDSGDRQPLLDAYHDGACFSLVTPHGIQVPARCSLPEYQKDCRNLKKIKDSTLRFRLLRHTRLNVAAFLNELPKTQHDTSSFTVDVNMYTNMLLSFTISGVFREVDCKSRDPVRAFSRIFIAVPAGNSGLSVVNDQLFVRNATTEEIRQAFAAPAPTPSSSPVPTLSAAQQEMLSAFALKSGMNMEWAQKCLQCSDWDFNKAAQTFEQQKVRQ
uniref:Nuclear RNA export factor 1 n=1 Tax=Denticeps clupeoides TaxID=299321 RepID=A0AAY4BY77_9TELE